MAGTKQTSYPAGIEPSTKSPGLRFIHPLLLNAKVTRALQTSKAILSLNKKGLCYEDPPQIQHDPSKSLKDKALFQVL